MDSRNRSIGSTTRPLNGGNKSVNRSWLAFWFFKVASFVQGFWFFNGHSCWSANPVTSNIRPIHFPVDDDLLIEVSNAVMNDDAAALRRAVSTLSRDESGGWLTLASQNGKLAAIKVLLAANADVNYSTDDGETPLSFACSNNQFEAAKLLHSHGADVNAKLSDGTTPLDVACCWSSPEFRDWLRSVGAVRYGEWDPWPWPPDQA